MIAIIGFSMTTCSMGRLHSRGKVLELEMDLMMLNIAKCFVVLMC